MTDDDWAESSSCSGSCLETAADVGVCVVVAMGDGLLRCCRTIHSTLKLETRRPVASIMAGGIILGWYDLQLHTDSHSSHTTGKLVSLWSVSCILYFQCGLYVVLVFFGHARNVTKHGFHTKNTQTRQRRRWNGAANLVCACVCTLYVCNERRQ